MIHGDWRRIEEHGPYDLLVLDGGGTGKTPSDDPADPARLLTQGGTVVVDDPSPRPPDGRPCTKAPPTGPGCTG
ncbi:hypothetical protein HEP84_18525 [Streptomyces sp. RLB1-33]|uniref:hypothetical protein n=1 Tax=Streptomyces mirabilis TaxID=68239 RepID=UPI0032B5E631